jgi:hypothetical protein
MYGEFSKKRYCSILQHLQQQQLLLGNTFCVSYSLLPDRSAASFTSSLPLPLRVYFQTVVFLRVRLDGNVRYRSIGIGTNLNDALEDACYFLLCKMKIQLPTSWLA